MKHIIQKTMQCNKDEIQQELKEQQDMLFAHEKILSHEWTEGTTYQGLQGTLKIRIESL